MKHVIIGGGPAGLMCACIASQNPNNQVFLLEKNSKLGKKLFITGKGRCNLTNNCAPDDFLQKVVSNSKFLMSAIHGFSPEDCMRFFSSHKLPLVVERGNRVFPKSNKASDVTKTLEKIMQQNGVHVVLDCTVFGIKQLNLGANQPTNSPTFCVQTSSGDFECNSVVIATGGKSYPSTGSTGDGYNFATSFGHQVVPLKPSLVPFKIHNHPFQLAGLTLKNVCATINVDGKAHSQFGEVLFTHDGLSGPAILTLSALLSKKDLANKTVVIDLKPALTLQQLEDRIVRDNQEFGAKNLGNYLKTLMPQSLVPVVMSQSGTSAFVKLGSVTKQMRTSLCMTIKNLVFKISSTLGFDCAIVTSGGVCTNQINPKNMQSKLVPNLFFVGEVLDVDALTGGFNIQIAFSTGYAAGQFLRDKK